MKEIHITQGKVAIVDDIDYEMLSQYKWQWNGRYVIRRRRVSEGGDTPQVYMHRQVAGAKEGEIVDHEDCNTLNNVRSNLRLCAAGQNVCNRRVTKISKTGVKGVMHTPGRGRNIREYRAKVKYKGVVHLDRMYHTLEEAKAAYDACARQVQGEFSRS